MTPSRNTAVPVVAAVAILVLLVVPIMIYQRNESKAEAK